MTDHKLDIFATLDKLSKKDAQYYAAQPEEIQKQIQPFVLMRWLTGASDLQVLLINEVVNPYAFQLTKHKELLWQLLCVTTSGRSVRYKWIKGPSRSTTGVSTVVKAIKEATGYNTKHAVDALALLCDADVIELVEGMGWPAEEVAKVKKELKGRHK